MMMIIGLFIIPLIVLIILRLKSIKIKKFEKILLNILLIFISILFVYLCIKIGQEPFVFDGANGTSDILIEVAVIFLFTPFLWIVTAYYTLTLTKKIRVRKNSIIKKSEYTYYRDDLNKISPNIIMFTSMYDVDYKKSISSIILKLKLTGFIKEQDKRFICTSKDQSELSESEKMVLNLVKNNDFDTILYKKQIEAETIGNKYIKKNKYGKFGRIALVFIIILSVITSFYCSIKLDKYTFDNYRYYTDERNGDRYIKLGLDEDIKKAIDESDSDDDFLVYEKLGKKRVDFHYIKADRYDNSVVMKAKILVSIVPISILFCIVWSFVSLYMIIEQLVNLNKNYRRTIKGKDLLSKAYALKNFLEDFSNDKNEKELIFWEYYLIYATVLGVNVKIQDEVIEKYIK